MDWIVSTTGAAEVTERRKDALAFVDLAAVAGDHANQRSAIRTVKQRRIRRELVGR